jgi:glucokinase
MTPTASAPWLVADIGGTNARFGLVTAPGGAPSHVEVLRCAHYPDLVDAVEAYLAKEKGVGRPTAACVAVAGPVGGDTFRLTNAAWNFSVSAARRALGLEHLSLVNDFGALALSLPHLGGADLVPIGKAGRVPGLPMAVVGPGTGLGVSALIPQQGRWFPLATEGGHVTLPAETPLELEVAALLRRMLGQFSAETVLCGGGLVHLYRALCAVHDVDALDLSPAEVCARGHLSLDAVCVEVLRVFCALLGSFVGNVALTLGARGGVMLGGGILPRIADLLEKSDFRARFEDKSLMAGYLSAISTELIVAQYPALLGASAWLTQAHQPTTSLTERVLA